MREDESHRAFTGMHLTWAGFVALGLWLAGVAAIKLMDRYEVSSIESDGYLLVAILTGMAYFATPCLMALGALFSKTCRPRLLLALKGLALWLVASVCVFLIVFSDQLYQALFGRWWLVE